MKSVETFAEAARAFCNWAESGDDTGKEAVANGLSLISRMYALAQDLPGLPDDVDEIGEDDLVSPEEVKAVYRRVQRLPLGYYSEIFNPLLVPAEEPVVGDLADDVADIYSDIASGLRLLEERRESEAIWEWVFGLQFRWGEHATSAMRAMYWWLRENTGPGSDDDAQPGESSGP